MMMNAFNTETNSMKFTNYVYNKDCKLRVMNSIANRKNVEKRTLLIHSHSNNVYITPRSVARAVISAATQFANDFPIKIKDCGHIAPNTSENSVIYCVLDSEVKAFELSQLFRLDIPLSKNRSARCCIQLMSSSLINLRVNHIPPSATIADLVNFANYFGEPKLLEQEMLDDEILTDSYSVLVEPHANLDLSPYQRITNGEIICDKTMYSIQFVCTEPIKKLSSVSRYDYSSEKDFDHLHQAFMVDSLIDNVLQEQQRSEESRIDDVLENSNLNSESTKFANTNESDVIRIPCDEKNIEEYVDKARKHDSFQLVSCSTCGTPVLQPDDGNGLWSEIPMWAPSRWDRDFHATHEFEIKDDTLVTLVCKK